jgi:hypothetical protein
MRHLKHLEKCDKMVYNKVDIVFGDEGRRGNIKNYIGEGAKDHGEYNHVATI